MNVWKQISVIHQKSCKADCLPEEDGERLGL